MLIDANVLHCTVVKHVNGALAIQIHVLTMEFVLFPTNQSIHINFSNADVIRNGSEPIENVANCGTNCGTYRGTKPWY